MELRTIREGITFKPDLPPFMNETRVYQKSCGVREIL